MRNVLVIIAIVIMAGATELVAQKADNATIFYLVRHAEVTYGPEDGPRPDPHLNEEGVVRAASLAQMLRSEKISAAYYSGYHRTLETALPIANMHHLEVKLYDPRQLEAFAKSLKSESGRIVVAGHSNSTPELVKLLGGDPGPPIDHEEYDRLYILRVPNRGPVTSIMLRF